MKIMLLSNKQDLADERKDILSENREISIMIY